ncbi:MAG: hypothetical protein WCO25_00325 [Candidatus Uhrbacteria bacterium]
MIRPRGWYAPDEFGSMHAWQREEIVRLAFEGIDDARIAFDFSDLNRSFTPPAELHEQLLASGISPIIVVGSGYVLNGDCGSSDIQGKWKDGKRLWNVARFRVVTRQDECRPEDLPPRHDGPVLVCPLDASSTSVREAYADGNVEEAERQLQPQVAAYIARHGPFRQIEPSI